MSDLSLCITCGMYKHLYQEIGGGTHGISTVCCIKCHLQPCLRGKVCDDCYACCIDYNFTELCLMCVMEIGSVCHNCGCLDMGRCGRYCRVCKESCMWKHKQSSHYYDIMFAQKHPVIYGHWIRRVELRFDDQLVKICSNNECCNEIRYRGPEGENRCLRCIFHETPKPRFA
jgi:hypothetical protein